MEFRKLEAITKRAPKGTCRLPLIKQNSWTLKAVLMEVLIFSVEQHMGKSSSDIMFTIIIVSEH